MLRLIRLSVLAMIAALAFAQSNTPVPLRVTRVYNITTTPVTCTALSNQCIDNRSSERQNNIHTFYVTGTGTWSVTLQYSSTGASWTSFSNVSATVDNSDVLASGYAVGNVNYLRFNITGTVSITYGGAKDIFPMSSAADNAVTSVGLSAPSSIFSVGSTPVTGSGTLALSYATGQTANYVFGTNASGAVGLMALTANQVPDLSSLYSVIAHNHSGVYEPVFTTLGVSKGGTGAATLTGVLLGNGTSAFTAATYANIVSMFGSGSCSGYLKHDGTCVALTTMTYPGDGVANASGGAWGTSYTVGTSANNLLQLNASAQIPAVSGALLTGLAASQVSAPGSTTQLLYNNTGALAGLSNFTYSGGKFLIGGTDELQLRKHLLIMNGTSGGGNGHLALHGGSSTAAAADLRWQMGLFNEEAGANAGSDLVWWRYADDGAYISRAWEISRSTGNTIFYGAVRGNYIDALCVATGSLVVSASGEVRYGCDSTTGKPVLSYNGGAFKNVGDVEGASNLTTAGRVVTVSAAGTVGEQSAVTVSAGVVTATGFSGPITGDVTGNVSGSSGSTTGNAATATALAANGGNCSAGQFPLGVDASGAVESCTALPTTISGTANEVAASVSTGAITLSLPSALDLGGKTVEMPNGTDLPGTCTVGQIFYDVDATAGENLYGCTASNTWTQMSGTAGFSNPMTTEGDIITGGASGTPQRLAAGTEGYFLGIASGVPAYIAPPTGTLPSQTGNAHKLLSTDGTDADWRTLGAGLVADASSVRVDTAVIPEKAGANTFSAANTFSDVVTVSGAAAALDGRGAVGGTMPFQSGTAAASPVTCTASEEYYNATDGSLQRCNGTGDGWVDMTGSGAPTDATYLTATAEAGLSAESNLGALTTGLLKITVSGGTATPSTAAAGTDYVAPASSETLTNKTLDAEGTGNAITVPVKFWLPATGCAGTTGSLMWDTLATLAPTATCSAGTTNTAMMRGVADFPDSDGEYSMQQSIALPADWSGAIDARIKWSAAATSGDAVWQVKTICVADAEVDDAAWNTASTVTDTAKGTTLQTNDAAITGVTATGCAAGELMHLMIMRDRTHASDSIAGVISLIGVEITARRAM